MRGTSGTPRHTKLTRYRCSLPGLAGFAGNRCTEPEVPPTDGLRRKLFSRCDRSAESSTAFCAVKGCAYFDTAGSSLERLFEVLAEEHASSDCQQIAAFSNLPHIAGLILSFRMV